MFHLLKGGVKNLHETPTCVRRGLFNQYRGVRFSASFWRLNEIHGFVLSIAVEILPAGAKFTLWSLCVRRNGRAFQTLCYLAWRSAEDFQDNALRFLSRFIRQSQVSEFILSSPLNLQSIYPFNFELMN